MSLSNVKPHQHSEIADNVPSVFGSHATPNTANPHLAPRPNTFNDIGVSKQLLLSLLSKHMYLAQISTLESLTSSLSLPGKLVQELLMEAKQLMWVENRAATSQARFCLSATGKAQAQAALRQSGYAGPAPVSLATYHHIVTAQTHRQRQITRSLIDQKLVNESFDREALDAVGMSLNSTKPVLLYGLPGTGKSYLCRNLINVLDDKVLQPYAIEVNEKIIQLFDPQIHQVCDPQQKPDDTRFQIVERPLVITGGELTLDMLEVSYDPSSRLFKAPLQMKANNGVLLLDDLGRQKLSPTALFNRWIIPLEENIDFLSLDDGTHFKVPFELMMLFSTNLEPETLVDSAFLRRLGYKIHMQPMSFDRYFKLWQKVSNHLGLICDQPTFEYVISQYHQALNRPLLPCYPRDLLGIVKDAILFSELPAVVTPELIDNAWRHYFVTPTRGLNDE